MKREKKVYGKMKKENTGNLNKKIHVKISWLSIIYR